MLKHNPVDFTSALSAKLASRSRHVCVFLGAGSAQACGLPGVAQLQEKVISALGTGDKEAFQRQLRERNLEEALTRIRRIAALVSGEETFDGLTCKNAKDLDAAVCKAIVETLNIQSANVEPVCQFAAWTARADYNLPVEIFTVNYDLLLETALDHLRVPYFDGFVGTIRAGFHTGLVEGKAGSDREWIPAFFIRLWKMHGSVNWLWQEEKQIVRLGHPIAEGTAAIFPSDTKYEESRRVPFVVLQDRFRRALHEPETFVLISGYSFSDDHLNDIIFDAALHRPRSEFQVFCYSDIPEVLAAKALATPNLQVVNGREAIIGGVRREWAPPEDPPTGLWIENQFGLRDFTNLAAHLARSVIREAKSEMFLHDLLEKIVLKPEAGENKNDNA
ncbi:MAG: SIR2 family protein [Deltaproteobacteria bacterium]|nr:SIR2 family protein [Deltaproteobacteria bacterium]